MRPLLLALALALTSVAAAQRCGPELRAAAQALPPDTQSGVMAARLLASAVRWVEPALPPLSWSLELPIAPGEPGYDSVRYLAERRLLPADWSAGALTAGAWSSMLGEFLAWYELPPLPVTGDLRPEGLIADLAEALERVSESVRPLALVASAAEDRSRLAFLGLVWNWTVYPRLIVRRPGPEQTLEHGVEPLLRELSNCAVELRHYVYAPEDTARRLFLSHAEARMFVIGSEPELPSWPLLVPSGQEEEYFAFDAPEVSDLVAYAAAFDGNRLGVRTLMTMLPRLRTNLPPMRLPGLLRTPAAVH